jgi:Neutral/alkaline non-lysosomal ceramidase, N-terminal
MRWFTVLGFMVVLPTAASAEDLRAGAAKTVITPPVGYPMWGYAARHDAPSTGVLDPLHARAVVLAADGKGIAFISLDLGRAPTRSSMATIRKQVKQTADVDHIFIVGSHTHHGPVLETESWPDPKTPYVRELEAKLISLITTAAKELKPARLGLAAKDVNLNRNRHSRRADKPVDRELIVVRIEDMESKPIAHLVNFAAHPTMIEAKDRRFSADYPGVMAGLVEKESGAPCLFLQGASGDLSANPGAASGYQKFGAALGREVLGLAKPIRCEIGKELTVKVRERDFQFAKRIDLDNPVVRAALSYAFFPEIVDFYAREYKDGIRPHLTTALIAGKIGVVGVSGEFFCSHALSLKRRARLEHLLFLGYCNDYQQYFPTIEAVSEGGYGTGIEVSPVELGAGERIIDRALLDLYELGGKIKR